jgi:type III restriction/modification enzyme restriction subunit
MASRGRRRAGRPVPFNRKLVLNQWLLDLFGLDHFEGLAEHLRDETLEGLDLDNVHRFHTELCLRLPGEQRPELPDDVLLEYDQAIVSVTQRLNERRITRGDPPLAWKYFQYVSLLSTEIYLDRYFRDPQELVRSLNGRIESFNEGLEEADHVTLLDEDAEPRPQLNKIAFWMATGSGKTLLMHAHILQYRRFLETHGRARDLNRIILLTPNEGLSEQHLREFEKAGIEAEIFDKEGRGLFSGHAVEILEVTKLKEEMGDKTVAVDAFEGNNLVLVDEGHRGASAGAEGSWMKFRNALCENGFSFEYSATFGQAMKGKDELADQYARSTLFDYSYRWFYGDGFGKDHHILNLEDDTNDDWMATYLTACLLSFFQQQRLFREQGVAFRPFNIERPLWIFVGGSVNAVRTRNREKVSDVVAILRFLRAYVANRADSISRIERVLHDGLVTAQGKNLFAGRFAHLNMCGLSGTQLFEETLGTLFNAPGGGTLHVENLKGAPGEVAVRVGDNDPFGLINVGDDAKLVKLCGEKGLSVGDRDFAGSLFHDLNEPQSSVHVLIGSKKFTEGWSSWRVSTMGLMNVGRGEGAQIIQLFGRGVRLKGHGMSLKRSPRASLPVDLPVPKHIDALETLNIFGVRADYMAQFRDFLEVEGVPKQDDREEFILPIIKNLNSSRPLKTVRLRKEINGVPTGFGDAFRKLGPVPTLGAPGALDDGSAEYLRKNRIVLNWYPKIQARASGVAALDDAGSRNETTLTGRHVAFLDLDRIFFEMERFKAERGWYNLNLTRAAIADLLADETWYRLQIPERELAFDSFTKVRGWQEIATALLRTFVERYYRYRKRAWELPHLEYVDVTEDDPNFPTVVRDADTVDGYRILINESQEEIVAKLTELKEAIEAGDLSPWKFGGIQALSSASHLYRPLLYVEGKVVEVSPVSLNKGERRFVEDLMAFQSTNPEYFEDRELYLLRNQSRGRGVGFFEAGNFHPDFILWEVENDEQRISFIDPKGIRNVPLTDPKIRFYESVKEIEQRLGDSTVTLESFIVSNTPSHTMKKHWQIEKAEMVARHVLFQDEDRDSYIGAILREG